MSDVTLRPVAEDDLPVMELFLTDPASAGPFQWLGWWDVRRWRRQWAENGLITADMGYLMVVHGQERLGFVGWRKIAAGPVSYCWNMGIALLPQARGNGAGTEAQRLLVRYLFGHTQVRRIEADTEVTNVAERRALEKVGFTREGVRRAGLFRDGEWRDAVVYSILREEFDLGSGQARREGGAGDAALHSSG